MSRAIIVHEVGAPEALKLEDRAALTPKAGEVVVRNEAIGLNFVDVYQRTGLYKMQLPFTPGGEGAGIVSAIGDGVTELEVGQRVLYNSGSGSYADEIVVPEGKVVPLPDEISTEIAATLVTKAGTAHYLLFESWPFKPSDNVLVHAAAGGVGSFLVQWASALGATVIALAGGTEKVAIARTNGAAHAFDSNDDDWVAKVRAATGGRGVDVVFDGVGKATFERSLDCLRPRGLMVSFGNASGPVTGVALSMLQTRGSLYVTRPTSGHYFGNKDDLRRTMNAVFEAVRTGKIRPEIKQRFKLADAGDAHRALEGRKTTGATILVP
ncbi:MAG TPA: quinone oxidoreductase [Devosia sp.]|nr:quinone oxidoreductase [Devosia sp.]